jgi:ferrochelatase
MSRLAVVLFNLGGPDSPDAVRPFLFNLFNDPAIIALPSLWRRAVAWLISTRRAPIARKIYGQIGGQSPLLALTCQQADALAELLNQDGQQNVRCFIAMRYWHPLTKQTVDEVMAWAPDRIVLLPLYPQFSSTTTGSSLTAWTKTARKQGLATPTVTVCCYPTAAGMIAAQAELLRAGLTQAGGNARVLFSAHGLPKKIVARGDPYQAQVVMTAEAIVQALDLPDLDWQLCFQSRVGPLEWIGPATTDEIARAGQDGKTVVIQPIAFVSEHSETLVELDIEYAHLAKRAGVPNYIRIPALGTTPAFIQALAGLVRHALIAGHTPCSDRADRVCPSDGRLCAQGRASQ